MGDLFAVASLVCEQYAVHRVNKFLTPLVRLYDEGRGEHCKKLPRYRV